MLNFLLDSYNEKVMMDFQKMKGYLNYSLNLMIYFYS